MDAADGNAVCVLPDFRGVAVHDGWAPYRRYEHATHALCNAHHAKGVSLRELDFVADRLGQDWAGFLAETLTWAKRRVDAARERGEQTLDGATLAAVRARYAGHVAQGHAANPPPKRAPGQRGGLGRSKAANLLARLDTRRDEALRFTVDFRVPFDDNRVERDIRMVKLQQKISGCWRTMAGAQAFCATRSYLATARKQHQPVLAVLRGLFDGDLWLPATATG